MFTRIVLDSAHSSVFLDRLELGLSEPQRQHLLNLADALLVCEDTKTLARLRRQFPAVLVARAEQGASRGDAQAEAAGASHICMMQRWWIAFRVQAGGWLAVLQVFLAERDNPSPRLDTHGEVMRSGDAPWEPRYICWRGPRVVGRNWRAKVNSFFGERAVGTVSFVIYEFEPMKLPQNCHCENQGECSFRPGSWQSLCICVPIMRLPRENGEDHPVFARNDRL